MQIGPLAIGKYLDFLPGGGAFAALRALAGFFSDDVDFKLQLVLAKDDVPACELGSEGPAPMLGLLTWIKSRPFGMDADNAIIDI